MKRLKLFAGGVLIVLGAGVIGAVVGLSDAQVVVAALIVMPVAWATWVLATVIRPFWFKHRRSGDGLTAS